MIHARGLARTFRKRKQEVRAVDGVDLDVARGEIVGFLGPNGAGKTTTLRMLTTLIEPSEGTATVAGCDLRADPIGVRRRIGYVPQSGSTYQEARAGEEIVDHALMYGMDKAAAISHGRELFETLDLEGMWKRQPKSMSGGQRRRLDIAMGLIHRPELVFLDEPTTGLDPQARANLWEHISALRTERDTTVFLTTHYLDEADALCDRILVIDHGRIVAEGTPDALKAGVGGDVIEVELADEATAAQVRSMIEGIAGAELTEADGRHARGRVPNSGTAMMELVRGLDAAAITPVGIQSRRPSLDDVFLTLTGRSLRDDNTHNGGAHENGAR
ncbi:daunorubicin resistance protein DrrA family ABC transporter ATP-binding protein [Tomitella biformata]|uniref:daunorubicin resistance protein DrrA family ABC transporter ATP-binding protein n=1 Tax=Tomitella biformata TaxID=630403 RepID=UPI000465C39F|nr:daunorubicin resistance protein DrrA family ABC transporter ATP-binding protein [Tomitella biformata]